MANAAETEAFNDSVSSDMGIEATTSHRFVVSWLSPSPSAPITTATGW
jgi:hypothetical protein